MLKANFTGYVLSGGKSSRMGEDKAFLKIGENTFLENAVETLERVCENVKIVLNKSQNHFIERLPENISYIFDVWENRGAVGGMHAAFLDCETKFAVILAVDLPFVTSKAGERLCKIISNDGNFSAIVPRQTDGKLQPLCAAYRVSKCKNVLENLLSGNDSVSARGFLEKINIKIIEAADLSANEKLFANINFQSDYKNLD